LFFSGHALLEKNNNKKNKTGMFVYCITDMTATLIKNPPKIIKIFNFSVQMMYVVNKIDK
jgi:hypothetical protein